MNKDLKGNPEPTNLSWSYIFVPKICIHNLLTQIFTTNEQHANLDAHDILPETHMKVFFFYFTGGFAQLMHCQSVSVSLLLALALGCHLLALGNLLGRGFALGGSWQWGLDLKHTPQTTEIHVPHNLAILG